ncbi:hypothetical protein FRC12_012313 [Ceratobasidium sp. 428]|nr:hypothetical protein FRC09_006628 [Ceratobasidium sp. 395]KAG8751673.1 hypothetical protein FRC12_012313 [Ceratobasidium sp. 428]
MHSVLLLTSVLMAGSVMATPVGLTSRQGCSDLQLVCLPGTYESGFGIVCGPLRDNLASTIPGTTAYAVPYNTSPEYVVSVAGGARIAEQYITTQSAQCPNQRFVIGGYSKGAMVVHEMNLSTALKSKVLTVAVFGDPNRKTGGPLSWPINSPLVDASPRDGSTLSQNVASFCNSGDQFCDPNGNVLPPHLRYGQDGSTMVAANFVEQKL